jgi:uncharacterized protein
MTGDRHLGPRNLSAPAFIVAAVVWLAVVKLVGLATDDRADLVDGRFLTVGNLVWSLVVPIGAGAVLVYGLIAALGWWRPLLHEPKPVQRWVWIVPAVFAVAILAGINYGGLADRGLGFTLVLLVVAMLVGFGEEGLFRCVGVTSLRRAGLTEGKVALWSGGCRARTSSTRSCTACSTSRSSPAPRSSPRAERPTPARSRPSSCTWSAASSS